MKIIRCQDQQGNIVHAAQSADGTAFKLSGDIYNSPQVTTEKVEAAKLLAPIQATSIICIGLNYRKHAEETGAKFPEYPVVFLKGIN
jgi:2-keto-4-pentenoate hydratase/2-oxohepta-3-ene-1,7-dioic acid hydratase in catechol pathway